MSVHGVTSMTPGTWDGVSDRQEVVPNNHGSLPSTLGTPTRNQILTFHEAALFKVLHATASERVSLRSLSSARAMHSLEAYETGWLLVAILQRIRYRLNGHAK